MNNTTGGAFLLARKIFDSDLWLNKPAAWSKIWIYILGNVNFVDNGTFKRGEGFFDFTREKYFIGDDISDDSTKKFMQYGRGKGLFTTKRSTRGVILSVCNYSDYQEMSFYRSTTESTREAPEKHQRSTPIHNNGNNGNNVTREAFVIPSIQQITVYCNERKNKVNPNAFLAFYESKGWMIGKNKVKDWKACVRTWELRDNGQKADETPKIDYGPAKTDCGHCKGTGSIYAPGSGKIAVCGCRYPKKDGQ